MVRGLKKKKTGNKNGKRRKKMLPGVDDLDAWLARQRPVVSQ